MQLAGGWAIFMIVVLGWGAFTLITLYTRSGSGINQRPYGGTDAPGARGASVLTHDETAARRYTRGTRA